MRSQGTAGHASVSGGPARKPPALMDPERERDRGRILALFKPYRVRLAAVIGLIVFSSGLSMVSPFLLRDVLDTALPRAQRRRC